LRTAAKLAPSNPDYLLALADALLAHGEPLQASAAYLQARRNISGHHFEFSLSNRITEGLSAATQASILISHLKDYTDQGVSGVGLVGHTARQVAAVCPRATPTQVQRWTKTGINALLKPGKLLKNSMAGGAGEEPAFDSMPVDQLGWL
jgi:hypothetical protein